MTATQHQCQHYCVTRRRSRAKNESKSEFDYAVIKQKLVGVDLMRFNVKTIYVDDFPAISQYELN
jgi:hypothetical protein